MPPPNSWPSEDKLWELLSSRLSVLTLANCRVFTIRKRQCSVPSSVGTPAPLIEPQSVCCVRLARRTGGLDLDVLRCRSKYSNWSENAPKCSFRHPKWNYGKGTPQYGGAWGDTPAHTLPHIHSAPARDCYRADNQKERCFRQYRNIIIILSPWNLTDSVETPRPNLGLLTQRAVLDMGHF